MTWLHFRFKSEAFFSSEGDKMLCYGWEDTSLTTGCKKKNGWWNEILTRRFFSILYKLKFFINVTILQHLQKNCSFLISTNESVHQQLFTYSHSISQSKTHSFIRNFWEFSAKKYFANMMACYGIRQQVSNNNFGKKKYAK